MLKHFALAMFLSCALIAQRTHAQSQTAGAAKAQSVAAVLNAILSDAERDFVDAAEAMPPDKFNFVPTGGEFRDARSFAGTIKHVIWANYLLAEKVTGSKRSIDQGAIDSLAGRNQILLQLKESFTAAHKAIDTLSPDNMLEGGDGRAARLGSAAFLTAHTLAHCGELIEYLRMCGIVPPKSWS